MQVTKYNSAQPATALQSWVDDFFNKGIQQFFGADSFLNTPSVNIKETDKAFFIDLAAPGMLKEDFDVRIEKNILKVSAKQTQQSEKTADDGHYTRREFNFQGFSRQFTLPETVDTNHVEASYEQGILRLQLAKSEVETAKTIEVAVK